MKKSGSKKALLFIVSMLSFFGMFLGLNNGVKAYAAETVVTTIASGFQATDVVADGSGHLYLADITNERTIRMNNDGTNLTDFSNLVGRIAIDNVNGYVYIAEGNVVTRMDINNNNNITNLEFTTPVKGIAVDGSGQVYVGCNEGIVRMNSDGTGRTVINSIYNNIYQIAVDDVNGYIYAVVSSPSPRYKYLVRMDIDGSDSISITSSRIINDVAVDANGTVYYTTGSSVRKINSGVIEAIATDIGAVGIAADGNGYIYVTDLTTSTVKRIVSIEQFIAETKGYIENNIDNESIMNIGGSLVSKFDNFSASLGRENNTAAANQLNAFINEVSAQQGKKIADDVAVMLISRAQALLEKIEARPDSKEAMTSEAVPAAEEAEVFETMSTEEPQTNELPTSTEAATGVN